METYEEMVKYAAERYPNAFNEQHYGHDRDRRYLTILAFSISNAFKVRYSTVMRDIRKEL